MSIINRKNTKQKENPRNGFYVFFTILFIQMLIFQNSRPLFGGELKGIGQENTLDVPKPLLNVISVDIHNIPFEDALNLIAKKGRFQLNYNRSRLLVHKKITVKMRNVPALKVLMRILSETGAELRINKSGNCRSPLSSP